MTYLVNGQTVRNIDEARTALTIARNTGNAHAVRQAGAVLRKYEKEYFAGKAS